MYDFYLGEAPQDLEGELRYLVSVKRLLPRWCNSIPDAQFASIIRILHRLGREADRRKERLCLVETGAGASSLALIYFAIKHRGRAYTWDFNGNKASEIRQAAAETMGVACDAPISRHWRVIGYNSLSPLLGIPILKELGEKVHFSMHDSEHVWDTVGGELELVDPCLSDGSVVALDDAYYDFKHTDTAMIGILRRKLGLGPAKEPADNRTRPHSAEAEAFLRSKWKSVTSLTDDFKRSCRDDVSVAYYGNELQVRSDLGMAKVMELESRFAAWEVSGRV